MSIKCDCPNITEKLRATFVSNLQKYVDMELSEQTGLMPFPSIVQEERGIWEKGDDICYSIGSHGEQPMSNIVVAESLYKLLMMLIPLCFSFWNTQP